ncbi:MAG TPA: hypothetical protein VH558_15050 [Pseudolabrys sp.]|jgi:hypothetical protein
MHKAIIFCLAFVVLTSPLHAESAGSAALKGGAKGAGGGGGFNNAPSGLPSKHKTSDGAYEQMNGYIRQMKATKTTKPVTSGSSQTKGRR